MISDSTARADILLKIRLAAGSHSDALETEYAALPRTYRQQGTSDRAAVLTMFTNRLRDYDAGVYRCNAAEIAETVAAAMDARGKTSLLRTGKLPQEWLPAKFRFFASDVRNANPSRDDLAWFAEVDQSEGVITGCFAAVAFTGTIILRHEDGNGSRALTLIPDYHLCVVLADQIVETVPEGLARLKGFETMPITTISGPSATADIEMTRVKGVHGPRFLDVIIVG